MKQFCAYHNLDRSTASYGPFIIILQSPYVELLESQVVAPLVARDKFKPATRLNPLFVVNGQVLALAITEIVSFHRRDIGKLAADFTERRDDIIAALDMLFFGY